MNYGKDALIRLGMMEDRSRSLTRICTEKDYETAGYFRGLVKVFDTDLHGEGL